MASIMKRLKSFLSRFLPPSRKAFQKSSSAILAETHRLETHLEQLEEEHLKAQELYHKDLASISRCLSLLTEENQQLKLQLQLQSEEITALRKGRKTQTRQVMQRFGMSACSSNMITSAGSSRRNTPGSWRLSIAAVPAKS